MHMILTRAQSSFSDVIKTTILLKDMKDFQTVNETYAQCFKGQNISKGIFHYMNFPKRNEWNTVCKIDQQWNYCTQFLTDFKILQWLHYLNLYVSIRFEKTAKICKNINFVQIWLNKSA